MDNLLNTTEGQPQVGSDDLLALERMKTAKITLKLVRSFGIGFTVHSPSLNGFSINIDFACFALSIWSRGGQWFAARSYWG